MFRILIALRQLVAFHENYKEAMDNVVTWIRGLIEEDYIDYLEKKLAKMSPEDSYKAFDHQHNKDILVDYQHLKDQLNMWKNMLHSNSIQGMAVNTLKTFQPSPQLVDWTSKALMAIWEEKKKHQEENPPETDKDYLFRSYVGWALHNRIADAMEYDMNHGLVKKKEKKKKQDENTPHHWGPAIVQPMENIPAAPTTPFEEETESELEADTKKYIMQHDKSDHILTTIYEVWMSHQRKFQINPENIARRIKFSEVVPELERKTGYSEQKLRQYYDEMKHLVVRFLKEVHGHTIPEQLKHHLKISSPIAILTVEEKLVRQQLRQYMANFILGGSLHEQIGKDYQEPAKVVALIRDSKKKANLDLIVDSLTRNFKAGSSLDGMSNAKARKVIQHILAKNTPKGLLSDTYWAGKDQVFKALDAEKFDWCMTDNKYLHDSEGRNIAKQWKFEIHFMNDNNKATTIYGVLTASGAGSVESPLDKYDVVVTAN